MGNKLLIAILLISIVYSCSSKTEKRPEIDSSQGSISNEESERGEGSADYSSDESEEYLNGCNFDNGTYTATVDYDNSETGYSATYTLDVEVQDCQVVQISFPNDGYLDEDHISYADIDADGNAIVDGEDGKTYRVHIDV